MKKIYIILTKSPPLLSRSIGWVTKDEYTHSSISFNSTIQPMYSAGRKYAFSLFPASLKVEPLTVSFYKYFNKSKMGIFYLEVSDEAYYKTKEYVETMVAKRLPFNAIGLLLCKTKIDYPREGRFFCSEFVSTALQVSGEIDILKKPNLYRPEDFTRIKGIRLLYKGIIKDAVGRDFKDLLPKETDKQ
ncbi:MAG TPA: hypothetical protein PLI19_00635 [Erysipelotrichaceae bacterium]|nr:hypothetical protein [Erysipelotrichaceae bacterium]HQB31811.1 hypothetical protein [Erysipelotrichaceae bacterium]